MTGVLGSTACVAALLSRKFSGQGCEIDLSLQEGVASVMPYEHAHAAYHEPKKRELLGFALMPNVYMPCKDGYVVLMAVLDAHWRNLMGAAGNPDWAESWRCSVAARDRGEELGRPGTAAAGMDHVAYGRGDRPPGPGARRSLLPRVQRRADDGIAACYGAGFPPGVHQPRRAGVQAARISHPHGGDAPGGRSGPHQGSGSIPGRCCRSGWGWSEAEANSLIGIVCDLNFVQSLTLPSGRGPSAGSGGVKAKSYG